MWAKYFTNLVSTFVYLWCFTISRTTFWSHMLKNCKNQKQIFYMKSFHFAVFRFKSTTWKCQFPPRVCLLSGRVVSEHCYDSQERSPANHRPGPAGIDQWEASIEGEELSWDKLVSGELVMMAVIRQKCDENYPAAADDWTTLPQDRGQYSLSTGLSCHSDLVLNHWTNVSVWDPIISPHSDHTLSQWVCINKSN